MKLLLEQNNQTLTPFLKESDIDIDAFFDKCAEYNNSSTMVMLATGLGFGFQKCKEFARLNFNRTENKLVYYEDGKEWRLYDAFCLSPNRDDPTHYGIRIIGNIQLHIAIQPMGDKIGVSVAIVEVDKFRVLYGGSIEAVKYNANPVSVGSIPDLSINYEGKEISLSPIEIYTEENQIVMLSIAGRQIINIQVPSENPKNDLTKLISLLPTT